MWKCLRPCCYLQGQSCRPREAELLQLHFSSLSYMSFWWGVVCPDSIRPCSRSPWIQLLHKHGIQQDYLTFLILHLGTTVVFETTSTLGREGLLLHWLGKSTLPGCYVAGWGSLYLYIISTETLKQEAFPCFSQHPLSNFSGSYGKKISSVPYWVHLKFQN